MRIIFKPVLGNRNEINHIFVNVADNAVHISAMKFPGQMIAEIAFNNITALVLRYLFLAIPHSNFNSQARNDFDYLIIWYLALLPVI